MSNGQRRRDSVSNDLILDNLQLDIEVIATDRHSGQMKTNPSITHVKTSLIIGHSKTVMKEKKQSYKDQRSGCYLNN